MIRFEGLADQAARWLQKEQLTNAEQWAKFVDVYRYQPDAENQGWRGEYWGKMMRGGALIYAYTQDEELYNVLTGTIRDMMTVAEKDGRVSSYAREGEFDSWDLWCRKYVLLGSEYYLDICKDEELKKELTAFLCRCLDYIIAHIGPDKKDINQASRSWYGVNSSSILEPVVRLYKLTGEERYLDFATYIVKAGGANGINIFELAWENQLYPYQYGVSKAYEMMSCFEGLLEYALVTGDEHYRTAVINFANAVRQSEISIIGSCGVTHELFDHTRTRQTVRYDGVMQETCVTVTWMKFCSRLLQLTGDSVWADEMEKSFYNAYLGALNVNHLEADKIRKKLADTGMVSTFMPFDSYSPLTPGKRGVQVGGEQTLKDGSYYGCCACIGAAGAGVFLQNAVTVEGDTVTINFFETGVFHAWVGPRRVSIWMETNYPADGAIRLHVMSQRPNDFTIKVRNPGWAKGGYMYFTRKWYNDHLEVKFDMPVLMHQPEHWDNDVVYIDGKQKVPGYVNCAGPMEVAHKPEEDNYVAYTRGPLTLAADGRMGKAADSAFVPTYSAEPTEEGMPAIVKVAFTPENGEAYTLVDYASAGKDWETTIAAWLPTRG
ncbi:MAG: glycoside hydrolase family 127 protein [Clostridia bacterium]|nr:glycoside hydrolase family 127 protein [Clostridia bacterium]